MLPKYRGAAPIQWAVLNGDKVTGLSTMYMNEKMDEGDIIYQEKTEIGEDETTGELWKRLMEQGSNLLVKTLKSIEQDTAPRIPQGRYFTMAPMLKKEIAEIDWEKTARQIKNKIRGLNPIMGTYTFLKDKKIKFWKVDIVSLDELKEKIEDIDNIKPGTVIVSNSKEGLYIKTIDGIIKVLEIQGENAKKMSISDFLRGTTVDLGAKFV